MAVTFNTEEITDILTYVKQLPVSDSKTFYNRVTRSYEFRTLLMGWDTKWIFKRIYDYLYEETGIEVKKTVEELYVHNYQVGDYFLKHIDLPTKIWNVGVCLNDDYEGGDFVVYNPKLVLPKKAGAIYAFESQREHEVLPVTSGERWSIIGFLERGHVGKNKPSKLL